ncbi:MAG TPA: sulfatase-like hydrolase/transferase [Oscillospiraceae bacterium]|nr:sulfatase-like hydrolase/transferase [Oscillospiraceae bacterium]HPF56629.1 sulfatase-like hydrolase/transferase [Clostridiales bacterium]HPK34279.1 sulfatase-like hydrolase/transferase [Oscillospiraceae bacterium]HPR74818.1 sulfatase-like hydrolase/transferase [Oscillospiraceae bacterium]
MKKKPTILFITTDEQHLETISAFGAKSHTTPNIDELIGCSDVYRNAYTACPLCLPSRCSWMTGLYPHNSKCAGNIYGASLPRSLPNLFTELKKQGYQTSLHGKCHFIPVPYAATRNNMTLEYEHFITYYKSLGMDTLNLQDDKNNSLWYFDDYSKELESKNLLKEYRDTAHLPPDNKAVFEFTGPDDMHPDAWVGAKALQYIEDCDGTQPQFIWTSFSGPHYPIDPPQTYIDKVNASLCGDRIFREDEWDDKTKYHCNGFFGPGSTEGSGKAPDHAQKNYTEEYWQKWRRYYFANVVLIDEWIGKIIESAREKFKEDLYIVFTTDHGEMMGNHSLWGKNGSLYQDVIHVPLVVHSPNQESRCDFDERVSSLELFPTILNWAGAEIPEKCDGKTLRQMVKDGGRSYILSLCSEEVALIKGHMKLEWMRYREDKMYYELYDIENDPHEFNNLYNHKDYAKIQAELEAILYDLEKSEGLISTLFYDFTGTPYWMAEPQK